MADGQRELAHSWTYDRLDAYGERRDSERLKASNLSEWPIEQEVRIMDLPERWQGLRCGLDPVHLGSGKSRENKKTPIKGSMPGTSLYLACYEKVICKPMAGSRLIYSMLEL